jgi:ABC-type sugar transport system substrate-binding protein
VTGNALPSDIEHFIAQGADRVVLKPVDLQVLKNALIELDLTG